MKVLLGMDQTFTLYQVDAFTSEPFKGNPAAVCVLDTWLPDTLLQAIAEENNLSETAYVVANDDGYDIRWFTPQVEVDLCGHATLAAAYVLLEVLGSEQDKIIFSSRSGELVVSRVASSVVSGQEQKFAMRFPVMRRVPVESAVLLETALGVKSEAVFKGDDYMVIVNNQDLVESCSPDFALLSQVDCRGIIVTAQGSDVDFVSRFFGPRVGINEDPVTGSAHCMLAPYWGERLGKSSMQARQLSRRGGDIECTLEGDNVILIGEARLYLKGEIYI